MRLSIIVPVHNMASGHKLEYCLDSLMNQTVSDYEVIAVDDASTDDSAAVLAEYERRYPRIFRVIRLSENLRQGGAKNRALDICNGDYIGFMDADDWAAEEMYEKMLEEAKKTGADIVNCDHVITDEHSMDQKTIRSEWSADMYGEVTKEKFRELINHTGHLVTKIYARHLFFDPALRFPEHMFYEDNALGVEIMHRAKKIAGVNLPLYYYYQHEGSTVHIVTEERCDDRMEAMRIMLEYAENGNYLNDFYQEIEYKFINLFYQNTLFSYMRGKQPKKLSFIRKMGKEMRERFPRFEQNLIYQKRTDPEEQRLIRLQQRSTLIFVIYYKALWFYRSLRYGKKE